MKRLAVIGEGMLELNGSPFGALHQTYGGDSLNTAIYLSRIARPGVDVKFVSVVGTDSLSDGLLQRWAAEGIDTSLVLRDPTRLPGLYWIQIDERGERSFLYWRSESAARYLCRHPDIHRIIAALAQVEMVYLSGISLAILPAPDRTILLQALSALTARGVTLAFDSNYRPALWASKEEARAAMSAILPMAQLLLVTFDDEQRLWSDATPADTVKRLSFAKARTFAIKQGSAGCLYSHDGAVSEIAATPVPTVIDTTAAGDAFNAGFLAGWLAGRDPADCCVAGNTLASVVIQHRGAIIPESVTPPLSALVSSDSHRSRK
jgi:2-dehydro-3-deoxygluconokinase